MAIYHHDYAAFDRNVLAADFMVAEMLARGERVLARAELTAPYDENDKDGQHYRDAFVLTGGVRELPTRRAYAKVSNTDFPTNFFVEFGTENNPRHRTLGNALDAAGG